MTSIATIVATACASLLALTATPVPPTPGEFPPGRAPHSTNPILPGYYADPSVVQEDVLPIRSNMGNADINRREQGDASMNPYASGLPDEMQEKLARRYADLFGIYLRHRKSVTRVTFWGMDDGHSWLNGYPIRGRTNYPLLIGRDLKPKPAFFAVLKVGQEKPPSR